MLHTKNRLVINEVNQGSNLDKDRKHYKVSTRLFKHWWQNYPVRVLVARASTFTSQVVQILDATTSVPITTASSTSVVALQVLSRTLQQQHTQ